MYVIISDEEKQLIEFCVNHYNKTREYYRVCHDIKEQIIYDYINQFSFNQKINIFIFLNNIFLKKIGIKWNFCYSENNPNFTFIESEFKSDIEIEDSINVYLNKTKQEINKVEEKIQFLRKLEERKIITREIDYHKSVLFFLSKISLLHKLLERKGENTEYSKIFENIFSEIENELENDISIAHSEFLGEIGSKKELDNFNFIKDAIEFYFKMGWLNQDTKIHFPVYVFIKLFSYSGKMNFNANTLSELWDKALEEKILEHFERNLSGKNLKRLDTSFINSLSGYEFESLLEKIFKTMNYHVVLTQNTQDQGADLIIERDNRRTVVQAKCYKNQNVGNGAVQEIVAAKKYYRADKALVVTNSSFTSSAMELADMNNVELWDGAKLRQIIDYFPDK